MKKLLAILLVLVTVLGLVACGGGKKTTATPAPTPGTTDPGTVTDPGTTDPDTTEPGDVVEEYVWDGNYETATADDVMKVGLNGAEGAWDGSLPIVTDGRTITYGMRIDSRVTDYETNPYTLWLEEQTGFDVQVVEFAGSAGDVATQLTLMFTGGEKLPEILLAQNVTRAAKDEFLETGDIVNIAGYYMTDAYYMREAYDLSWDEGSQYHRSILQKVFASCADPETRRVHTFPRIYDVSCDIVNNQVMINQKWLDAVGMEVPTTVDELYDVLVAFRDKDPNGNGKKDEIPMAGILNARGRGVEPYLVNAFIQFCFSTNIQVENGETFCAYDQDEYREALIYINKLVAEGLLTDMTFTMGSTELQSLINPAAGQPDAVGVVCSWINSDWQDNGRIDNYVVMPPLADATGRGGYAITDFDVTSTICVITRDAQDPKLAFRLIDFMCSGESYIRQRWGNEGEQWEWLEEGVDGEGMGHLGGDATYRIIGDTAAKNCRWFTQYGCSAEDVWQWYLDPNVTTHKNKQYIRMAQNTIYQNETGNPPEMFWF